MNVIYCVATNLDTVAVLFQTYPLNLIIDKSENVGNQRVKDSLEVMSRSQTVSQL
jgi:hypothetical protein